MDNNLYACADPGKLGTPDLTWGKWLEAGYDSNSQVAQVAFGDAEIDDYSVDPSSAAGLLLGKPTATLADVGPRSR